MTFAVQRVWNACRFRFAALAVFASFGSPAFADELVDAGVASPAEMVTDDAGSSREVDAGPRTSTTATEDVLAWPPAGMLLTTSGGLLGLVVASPLLLLSVPGLVAGGP